MFHAACKAREQEYKEHIAALEGEVRTLREIIAQTVPPPPAQPISQPRANFAGAAAPAWYFNLDPKMRGTIDWEKLGIDTAGWDKTT